MKVAILGGTTGMGRAIARELAARGDSIFLLGMPEDELVKSAADLGQRGCKDGVKHAILDLLDPATFEPAVEATWAALGRVDAVVITAGMFATQDKLEEDLEFTRKMLIVNYAHLVVFCEHLRRRLLGQGGGTLCVFSSVAGDRGRKPVALYGSSKAGLSHYLESLDHKYRAQGLVTVCVKPGFVKTGMTQGLKPPPFAGEPEQVARDVIRAIDRGKPVLYTPWPWQFVMMVIRMLPRFVMRRVGF
ncbi:MAG: SDR family NAD(P)-dependent oxidoreductase [Alphaproteobacteria bacterium]|nr:SDR family NAD(P)-dependent oxidoreductase [Alphaproteobacteria bacterium]MCB9699724.1 SDR family NAD(P)-dependent oxidoreductase [Alphaproteobacteria bacterium]